MPETQHPHSEAKNGEDGPSFWTGARGRVNPAGAVPEVFSAAIPAPGATAVEYFLSAADRSGYREALPRVAPDGFYSFETAAR